MVQVRMLAVLVLVLAASAWFGALQAQAQTPLNPSLTPPNFRTKITVRLYCGSPDCPQQVYDTAYVVNALGDIYAADSGILYPFNRTMQVSQFPISLRQYAVPGSNVDGMVGTAFRGDILTLWYEMRASAFKASFKTRIRFHPFTRACEILTWEFWGLSGGMPLSRAFVGGKCTVG